MKKIYLLKFGALCGRVCRSYIESDLIICDSFCILKVFKFFYYYIHLSLNKNLSLKKNNSHLSPYVVFDNKKN